MYLKKFEKPSPALLKLSAIERSLVVAGDFENADKVKAEVYALEEKESEEAQERAANEMLLQQKIILAKHEREIQIIEEQHAASLEHTALKKENDIKILEDRYQRAQKELEVFKEEAKLPPLKNKEKSSTLVTPRTQSRIMMCKQSIRNPKISVKPLGKLSLVNKKKRATSQIKEI